MTVIGLLGDRTTTTAMALAVSWQGERPVTVLEADPTGGSLIGWLDDPSSLGRHRLRRDAVRGRPLGTPIEDFLRDLERRPVGDPARVVDMAAGSGDSRADIRGDTEGDGENACDSAVGELDVVTAPIHPLEAERAVSRLPISRPPSGVDPSWRRWSADRVCLVDLGSRPHRPLDGLHLPALDLLVVVVAQRSSSEGSAAAHIGRMTGVADQLRSSDAAELRMAVLVVGERPFDPFEVGHHLRSRLGAFGQEAAKECGSGVVVLPTDPLAAAVLAGRAGMSARRWSRTRLGRAATFAARELAELTHDALDDPALERHAEAVGG
jgi:hypothetical protein